MKRLAIGTVCLGLVVFGCQHAGLMPIESAAEATEIRIPELPSGLRSVQVSLSWSPGAELQDAIDRLGPAGGILYLPEGIFKLETQVFLKSNVHLVGVPGQTVLVGAGNRTILDAANCTDVTIRHLVLDANENGNLQRAFVATHSARLGVFNCEIKNTGADAHGIELQKDVDEAQLIGNYLHDIGDAGDKWGTGITLGWGSSDAVITDNRIERASRAGINAHNDCTNLYVARNDVRQLGGEGLGIELWSNCSGTVEHNQVASWISFDGSAGVIRHNEVNGAWNPTPPKYGIEVVAGDAVQVLDNRVTGARMGLSLVKSNNCLFQGNVIDGGETGLQGYGANAPARSNAVLGNTFRNGSGRAMMLNQNCDGWTIEGNLIEGYGKSGIYLFGTDDATITGNTLRRTCQQSSQGEAAIYWNSDRKTRLVLSGNTLADNPIPYGEILPWFLPDR